MTETFDFAKLSARKEAFEEFKRVLDGFLNGAVHTFNLSTYEAANLRALLDAIQTHDPDGNPLRVLDTGDWLSQVRMRLPMVDEKNRPNVASREQIAAVRHDLTTRRLT